MKITVALQSLCAIFLITIVLALFQSVQSLSKPNPALSTVDSSSIGSPLQLFAINDHDIIIFSQSNTIARLSQTLVPIWKHNLPETEQPKIAFLSFKDIVTISQPNSSNDVVVRRFSFDGDLQSEQIIDLIYPSAAEEDTSQSHFNEYQPRFSLYEITSNIEAFDYYLQVDWITASSDDSLKNYILPDYAPNRAEWRHNRTRFCIPDLFAQYYQQTPNFKIDQPSQMAPAPVLTTMIHIFGRDTYSSLPLSAHDIASLYAQSSFELVSNPHHHTSLFRIMTISHSSASKSSEEELSELRIIAFSPFLAIDITKSMTTIGNSSSIPLDTDLLTLLSSSWLIADSTTHSIYHSSLSLYYQDLSGQLHFFHLFLLNSNNLACPLSSDLFSIPEGDFPVFIPPISVHFPPCFDMFQTPHFNSTVSPFVLPPSHNKSIILPGTLETMTLKSLPYSIPLLTIKSIHLVADGPSPDASSIPN